MNNITLGVIAMAIVVVASNYLVQFLIFDDLLTLGAFTYPFAFLVTDLMNRFYGPSAARKVVFAGFVTGVICSLIGSQIQIEFEPGVYGSAVPLRIAVGSGTAFLVAQMMDVFVFDKLRNGSWWSAPLASTLIGSALDTALFFTIAFSASVTFFSEAANQDVAFAQGMMPFMLVGNEAPVWVSLAFADWGVKLALAIIALIPFRIIVGKLSQKTA